MGWRAAARAPAAGARSGRSGRWCSRAASPAVCPVLPGASQRQAQRTKVGCGVYSVSAPSAWGRSERSGRWCSRAASPAMLSILPTTSQCRPPRQGGFRLHGVNASAAGGLGRWCLRDAPPPVRHVLPNTSQCQAQIASLQGATRHRLCVPSCQARLSVRPGLPPEWLWQVSALRHAQKDEMLG